MVDTAAAPAKKATKVVKKTVAKKPAAHPKYTEMIADAITSLKDRKGSSAQAIKKYIIANFKVEEKSVGPHIRLSLKRGVVAGSLKQVKGTGATGSFKLPEKVKTAKPKKATTPKKEKKVAAKKATKSPKKVAKTVAKNAAVKKTPKKSTKKVATPAAKKPIAKKAKKPAAKKAGAKK